MSKNLIHEQQIEEQFSQQAIPFTKIPGHYSSINQLIKFSEVNDTDLVLDVACGPGIVAKSFSIHCKRLTGLDLTKAMIEQAKLMQSENGLTNTDWVLGDAYKMPFPDNSFSLIYTRYSFHHLLNPNIALTEMLRVCKIGGRVMIADVEVPDSKSAQYDKMEKLRDSSHTHALTETEFPEMLQKSGLINLKKATYHVDLKLEDQLQASFPLHENEDLIRYMIKADIEVDSIGVNAREVEGEVFYSVPIAIYLGEKAESSEI